MACVTSSFHMTHGVTNSTTPDKADFTQSNKQASTREPSALGTLLYVSLPAAIDSPCSVYCMYDKFDTKRLDDGLAVTSPRHPTGTAPTNDAAILVARKVSVNRQRHNVKTTTSSTLDEGDGSISRDIAASISPFVFQYLGPPLRRLQEQAGRAASSLPLPRTPRKPLCKPVVITSSRHSKPRHQSTKHSSSVGDIETLRPRYSTSRTE